MAITVTTKIKEILKARDAKILDGQQAVLQLLVEVRSQIVAELSTLPQDSAGYGTFQMQQALKSIERHVNQFAGAAKSELGAGLSASWEMGAGLLTETLQVAGIRTGVYSISTHVLDTLKEFTFGRINSVSGDLYTRIQGELTLGVLGQKTPYEITSAIAQDIKDLPLPLDRWHNPIFKSVGERAEVITGTEMGRAFSMATEKSIEAAAETLPELKRMWLHAGHPKRARQIHILMHGQVRGVDKAFYTTATGYGVKYPRDPKAPISEVIRCGCTHIPYMPQWGDAEAFAANFDEKQQKANKPKGPYKQKEA